MKKYFPVILLFCAMGMAGAQNHVRFRHLGESDGLSNSNVNTIWQDEFGMIWIGTADGLNRYDGNDITVYRPASGNTGIYSNNIRKICGDRNGNIYIISKFALSHFDIRTEKFSLVRSAGIQTITCAGGKLFAATKDTVFVMDATHPLEKYYAVPEGGGEITCLLMTTSGHLYIGTDRGLIVIDSNRKVTRKIPGMHSLSIYEDSQKGIWIATRDKGAVCASVEGLFSLVDDGTAKSLNSNYVREINEDIYGNLWICTIDGINIYDKHSGTIRNSVDGNVDDMEYIPANCITKDRDNTFWIGCSGGRESRAYTHAHRQSVSHIRRKTMPRVPVSLGSERIPPSRFRRNSSAPQKPSAGFQRQSQAWTPSRKENSAQSPGGQPPGGGTARLGRFQFRGIAVPVS